MGNDQLKTEDATWKDHQELTYWLWAFMRDAEAYLSASLTRRHHLQDGVQLLEDVFSNDMSNPQLAQDMLSRFQAEADLLTKESILGTYHFVMTMGVLIRVLKRSQHLFPAIQPPYSRANHLLKEGKEIRDMIEHAYGKDGYLAGGGKNPGKFVRVRDGVAADATSTIVRDDGHWLGNRFCVEMAMREVQAIRDIADTIKAPRGEDH